LQGLFVPNKTNAWHTLKTPFYRLMNRISLDSNNLHMKAKKKHRQIIRQAQIGKSMQRMRNLECLRKYLIEAKYEGCPASK
jgi:hypothetical protein